MSQLFLLSNQLQNSVAYNNRQSLPTYLLVGQWGLGLILFGLSGNRLHHMNGVQIRSMSTHPRIWSYLGHILLIDEGRWARGQAYSHIYFNLLLILCLLMFHESKQVSRSSSVSAWQGSMLCLWCTVGIC